MLASVAAEDHTQQRLRLAVSEAASTPANLRLPHGITPGQKRPGLVVFHGHESDVDRICGVRPAAASASQAEAAGQAAVADVDARAYALHAVRAGYVVLALPLWGLFMQPAGTQAHYILHPHGHRLEWAPAAAFLERALD